MEMFSENDLRSVESRYKVGEIFYESFCSIGYYAEDLVAQDKILLVVHKFLHDPHGNFATKFSARQKKIIESCSVFSPRAFSVAHNGLAYLVLPYINGRTLSKISGVGSAAESIFAEIVSIVKSMHEAGVALGDITDNSFLIDDQESIFFLGSFGYVFEESPVLGDRAARFLSPEQFTSERFDLRSDVFALGALGYNLFTGHDVREAGSGDKVANPAKNAPSPSSYDSKISPWVDAVIGGCLQSDRQLRYSSAVSLDDAVREGTTTGLVSGGANPWLSRAVAKHSGERVEADETSDSGGGEVDKKKVFIFLGLISFAIVTVIFIVSMFAASKPENVEIVLENNELIATLVELAPSELKESIGTLKNPTLSTDAVVDVLRTVAASDNPVVTMLLLSAMRGEIGESPSNVSVIRDFAVKEYLERLSRQGLSRSVRVWKDWFVDPSSNSLSFDQAELFEKSVQILDVDRENAVRRDALQEIFQVNPDLATLLACALVLDNRNNNADFFKPVALVFLGSRSIPNARGRSFEELILVYAKTAKVFSEDAAQLLHDLKNAQIGWVLKTTIADGGRVSFEILDEILRRDIVPPYQKIFLEPLVGEERNLIPEHIVKALLSASLGDLSLNVLQTLSTWGGRSFERVFLSFAAIASESSISVRAIQTLEQRVLATQPAKSLVAWMQKQHSDVKELLAKPVGVLSLIDVASEEEISYAFNLVMSNSGGRELFVAGMSSDSQKLQREVMERIGPIMAFDEIVPLLKHEDPTIRIFAVKFLSGSNNITVLNEITRGYEREKNAEVIAAYKEHHWVIQRREE